MIEIETIAPDVVKVTPPEKLKADDFRQAAPQVDAIIRRHGKIRILVDATHFNGWENMEAFEKHMGFIKARRESIECGAIIAGQAWQHWLAGVIRLFVHPQVRVFDKGQEDEAEHWIIAKKAASADDTVDEADRESFPASDAPGWTHLSSGNPDHEK